MSVDARVAAYRAAGFLVAREAIGPVELAALREETLAQVTEWPREPARDFPHALMPNGTAVPWRVERVMSKPLVNDVAEQLAAHPTVVETVTALLGRPVLGADALVFKGPQGGSAVEMHSAHVRNDFPGWRWEKDIVNVGVYVDDADVDTGCLLVVPGSHRLARPELEALLEAGYDAPGVIEVPMRAGDVLVHSEYLVHGSSPTPTGGPWRRVLYYAFCTVDLVSSRGDDIAAARLRLMSDLTGPGGSAWTIPQEWHDAVCALDHERATAVVEAHIEAQEAEAQAGRDG